MNVTDKIKLAIEENDLLLGYKNVLIAFSGGPDSLCLLDSMVALKEYFNIEVYALHVNHMLRNEESDEDERFCMNFCKEKGVKLFTKRIDVNDLSLKTGTSIEEAARHARYKELNDLSGEIGSCAIYVAHNRDDRAETILFNIIRGTGAAGLRGIDHINGNIIRPMVDISRSEIEIYLTDNSLTARQDSSNLKAVYNRNKIRLNLIPSVNKDFRVNLTDNLIRMSDILKDDDDYMSYESEKILSEISGYDHGCFFINRRLLQKYHIALQRRVIRGAIEKYKGNLVNIEFDHVERLLDFCRKAATNSIFEIPGKICIVSEYEKIVFQNVSDAKKSEDFVYNIEFPGKYEFKGIILLSELISADEHDMEKILKTKTDSCVQYFDYDKMKHKNIVLRNRRENDYIVPLNFHGRKKLSKFFSDVKIPSGRRNEIKLFASGSEVLWIIGYRISDNCKIDDKTKTILKCEVEL